MKARLWIVIALIVLRSATASAVPRIDGVIAVVNDAEPGYIAATVTGAGFGADPAPFSNLWVYPLEFISSECSCSNLGGACTADRCIVNWSDTRIDAKWPATYTNRLVQVMVDGDPITFNDYPVVASYFTVETYNRIEASAGVSPTKLTIDGAGRLWGFHEFSRSFESLTPAAGTATALPLGRSFNKIFTTQTGTDGNGDPICVGSVVNFNTQDIQVDGQGRVWLSESGFPDGCVNRHDHSQVIRYNPATDEICIYNVPGNLDQVYGLFYQSGIVCSSGTCQDHSGRSCTNGADCDRVWFTQHETPLGLAEPAMLTWFDPDDVPCTNGSYDFSPGAGAGACGPRHCVDASDEVCTDNIDCGQDLCVGNLCPSGIACDDDTDCQTCCLAPGCTADPGHCNDGSGRDCTTGTFLGNEIDPDGFCLPLCGAGTCNNAAGMPCIYDKDCALGAAPNCEGGQCEDGSGACSTDLNCPGITECLAEDSVPGCQYRSYPLKDFTANAADIIIGDDNALWYTNYFLGGDIGRVDITSPPPVEPKVYPLAEAGGGFFGLGWPWKIILASKRYGQTVGDVVFTEFFGHSINRFDASRANDPACTALSGGANPCVTKIDLRSAAEVNDPAVTVLVNDLREDASGNIWFTLESGADFPTLAFVKRGFTQPVFFPPGSLVPYEIAERKFTTQSPNSGAGLREANRAVDGNTSGVVANGSVTKTVPNQTNPWWEVDLRASHTIERVRVWSCTAGCSGSLQDFYIKVSPNPITDPNPANCGAGEWCEHQTTAIGAFKDFTHAGFNGRYVRVQRAGTNLSLELAEVQVFKPTPELQRHDGLAINKSTGDVWLASIGDRPEMWRMRPIRTNLAQAHVATMALHWFPQFGPYVAVDGNTRGRNQPFKEVTLTSSQLLSPWWQVDLGQISSLNEVDVWGCENCPETLSNFYVLVSEQNFTSNDLATLLSHPAVTSFFVSGNVGRPSVVSMNTTGRYVRVQVDWDGSTMQALRLAEVEVFGSVEVACTQDSQCNDGNACTDDVCRHGQCDHVCALGERSVDGTLACSIAGQTCQNFKGKCCCRADAWPFDTDVPPGANLGYLVGSPCP